jgi:hypothetical protein
MSPPDAPRQPEHERTRDAARHPATTDDEEKDGDRHNVKDDQLGHEEKQAPTTADTPEPPSVVGQNSDQELIDTAVPTDTDVTDGTRRPRDSTPDQLINDIATQLDAMARNTTPPPDSSSSPSPAKAPVRSPSPPPLPPKDERYLSTSASNSRATSPRSNSDKAFDDAAAAAAAASYSAKDNGAADDTTEQSEIQTIMEQFENSGGPPADHIMSPRLDIASPANNNSHDSLGSPSFPPRRSSLVPLDKPLPVPADDTASVHSLQSPPPRTSSLYRVGTSSSFAEPTSPSAHAPSYKPAQPAPEPEPDLPFDFHRFLEQLRHRTADPVAKFLRSFLLEFGKKQWMVHEQVKIIGDFLEFIAKKMAQCEVWRSVSDAEFDNAREGMEKLVMNRLYNQTFSPAIPPPEPTSPRKGRRRQDPPGLGRKGQHQEDVERDEILAQKVRIYKWVREEHLDIQAVGDKGRKFLNLAQQELLKIKGYRAPRDKIICILNCCKVIFGYLRTSKSDQSADAFVPLLIYTVLQANPDHLVSNVQYILRFRNQDKLGGEAGYYISSLMGAVQFIEGLDKTSLTVTDEEFEKHVEEAVSAIAEKHVPQTEVEVGESSAGPSHLHPTAPTHRRMPSPHYHVSEKSKPSRPEVIQRNSMDAQTVAPRRSTSLRDKSDTEPEEENAAVAGLLRTIQRPLSTIGRIFSDSDTSQPVSTPQPGNTPRGTPHKSHRDASGEKRDHDAEHERSRQRLSAEDAAARQASAEAEQARKIQAKEHSVVVETLAGMFPQLDRDVIDDVVRVKEGR